MCSNSNELPTTHCQLTGATHERLEHKAASVVTGKFWSVVYDDPDNAAFAREYYKLSLELGRKPGK